MNGDRWDRLQQLFAAALELPPEERRAYLEAAAGDADLAADVLSLLRAHEAGGRLDRIADRLGALAAGEASEGEAAAPRRVGPYATLHPIARGGMGSVYLAERADGQLKYQVALKLLRRDLDTEELRWRFLAERQILARINHPNIARFLDGGITEEGSPYFVMEYVEGVAIDRYCDANRLGVAQRLDLFRTVCAAVQHAHRNLVVHRDLKPGNILVTADGTVKLLDFGIAKVLDPEAFPEAVGRTRTGQRLLTPEYASPEQLRGEPVTTASDVYQLGLLLYELLTGSYPQLVAAPLAPDGAAAAPIREIEKPSSVVKARRTTPDRLSRQLRGDLDNIVLRALREEPERRYASVEQLAEDVRRHLVGLPVVARPETMGYRAGKFVRRHRVGVAASSTIAMLLVAFAVGMIRQAQRVALERDRAQQVSDLLLELFKSASPAEARGDTITVVQVLDRGAERIRRSLRGAPALQATLLGMIAEVEADLGQLVEATALAREAFELSVEANGPEHPEAIRSLIRLITAFNMAQQFDSALAYAELAIDLSRRRLGPRSLEAGTALQSYSLARQMKGDLARARPALEEAVGLFREHADSGRLPLASALVNLAWMDENQGNLDSAEARIRESVAIRRAVLESDHPQLAGSIDNLADLLLRKGDVEEAEAAAAEALAIRKRIYPAGHPQLASSSHILARILALRGDLAGAEEKYREALAIRRAAYGDRSASVAQTLNSLALLLKDGRGDLRGAEVLFRESAATFRELRGPTDPWTSIVRANLAAAIYPQGRYAEAELILRDVIAALERHHSPTHRALGVPLLDYGVVLTRLGRHEESEAALRRSLDILRGVGPPGDRRIARAEAALGACLVDQGRLAQAEPLLLAAYAVLSEDAARREPFRRVAADALVKLYTRSGRPADAARYRGTEAHQD